MISVLVIQDYCEGSCKSKARTAAMAGVKVSLYCPPLLCVPLLGSGKEWDSVLLVHPPFTLGHIACRCARPVTFPTAVSILSAHKLHMKRPETSLKNGKKCNYGI